MPQTFDSKFQKDADLETILNPKVLPPDHSSISKNDKMKAQVASLTPKEQQALKVLILALNRPKEEAEKNLQLRLENESFVIQSAARHLTGLALTSSPTDQRLLVAHHLKDFFSALSLPPALDAAARQALRLEALTMLLKFGPQDDIERMLLIQLIASHFASVTCFSRASDPDTSPELVAQSLGQAQKMSRLFLDLERAFRLRRKQLGQPEHNDETFDPKDMAHRILFMLAEEGIFFDDEYASA